MSPAYSQPQHQVQVAQAYSAKAASRSPEHAATDDKVCIDSHLCCVSGMCCNPFLTYEECPCRQQATAPGTGSPGRHLRMQLQMTTCA